MMKVTIYTETTLAGPGTGNGKYGAVVEYVTKKGESVTREVYGEETTWYRSVLAAAAKGLRLLTRPCEVEIVTGCAFVASMINNGNVAKWGKNGWKNAAGEEIKMKELWKKIYCFMSIHKITAVCSKHYAYRRFLLEKMAGERKWEKKETCQNEDIQQKKKKNGRR